MKVICAWLVGAVVLAAFTPAGQTLLTSRYLLARVSDGAGEPISAVLPGDLVIEENGIRRDALDVRPAAYPVAVLLDTSQHARADFMQVRTAVREFTDRLSGREISVVTFGDTPGRVIDFTTDVERVGRAVDNTFARPDTDSYILDAIIEVTRDVRRRELPMCALVIVSAGGNDRSGRAPAEVLEPVLASRSVVYVAEARTIRASGRLDRPRGIRKHIDIFEPAAMALQDFLQRLAARTGGHYDQLVPGGLFGKSLQTLARRLTSDLIVEYAVPTDAPPSADLKLGVRLPGATVVGRGLPGPMSRRQGS